VGWTAAAELVPPRLSKYARTVRELRGSNGGRMPRVFPPRYFFLNRKAEDSVLNTINKTNSISEAQVLQQVLAGDTSAYGEIFRRHRDKAFALAYQYLHNHEEAKDVVQDAFIRAYRNLRRFDTKRSFGPWLLTIVRNLSIDLIRKRRHVSPAELSPDLPDRKGRDNAELRVLRQEVWEALLRLSTDQREIVFLKDYQGYSYVEIAEILGIPLGTVMSRLHHARRKLISMLNTREEK